MKLPSLLSTPSNKRFSIQPRYYDPVKEDIEQRTDRIKRAMQAKKMEETDGNSDHDSRIQGSFGRNAFYKERSTGKLRFVILVLLAATAVGYFYFGNTALYIVMGLAAIIFLFRKFQKFG